MKPVVEPQEIPMLKGELEGKLGEHFITETTSGVNGQQYQLKLLC